jgi:predicted transcriptional regulator/transcriptional regulator with XRE-family HTH domain
MAERKIFAGARVRRLRNRLGVTQTEMAQSLGISPSYLNLIERDQRPLTVQVLLKLSSAFEVDVAELSGEGDAATLDALKEVFADPLLASELPSASELVELGEVAPNAARAIVRLHEAWREALARLSDLSTSLADRDGAAPEASGRLPFDRVTAYFEGASPWFAELEAEAAGLAEELGPRDDPAAALKRHLREIHHVEVRVLPTHTMPAERARFDRHSMRLFLSERVPLPERPLLMARQAALLGHGPLLDRLVGRSGLDDPEAARLCRLAFARRFAEALLAPAPRLDAAARDLGHDVLALARRFTLRPSRVMARLAALGGGADEALPCFFVTQDATGAVLARLPGAGYAFPRFGALCGRLPLFDGLGLGRASADWVRLPDGSEFVMVAVAEEAIDDGLQAPPSRLVSALGLRAQDAARTAYASALAGAPREIGVTCRLCERQGCAQRTHPPVTRPAALLDYVVGLSPAEPA